MHRYLARAQPSFERVLLVQSGTQVVAERILSFLYNVKQAVRVDLVTASSSLPLAFDPDRGTVYSNPNEALVKQLSAETYTAVAVLCAGSPVLIDWKWKIALGTSARILLFNEDGAYTSVDLWNLKTAARMLMHSSGTGLVRGLVTRAQPSFESILLIESGPRKTTDQILSFLYEKRNPGRLDVLTCYSTPPRSFDFERGSVYSVNDESVRTKRGDFIRGLASHRYTLVAFLCTGSPILFKWKWILAARCRARILIINESANYFSLDVWNLKTARLMFTRWLNPLNSGLLGSASGLLLAPFSVGYLLSHTVAVHFRRWLRLRIRTAS